MPIVSANHRRYHEYTVFAGEGCMTFEMKSAPVERCRIPWSSRTAVPPPAAEPAAPPVAETNSGSQEKKDETKPENPPNEKTTKPLIRLRPFITALSNSRE